VLLVFYLYSEGPGLLEIKKNCKEKRFFFNFFVTTKLTLLTRVQRPLWYSLVPFGTLSYSLVLFGTLWHSLVLFGTLWYPLVLFGTLPHPLHSLAIHLKYIQATGGVIRYRILQLLSISISPY
jgi:hypothetical protein